MNPKCCNVLTGVDKTFQRGDLGKYGIYIKEIPVHKTKVGHLTKHSKSYWYELGGKHNVVKAQSIVPMDLSNFKVSKFKSRFLLIIAYAKEDFKLSSTRYKICMTSICLCCFNSMI